MKNEFEYPMWFKAKGSGTVVMFDGLYSGTVVVSGYAGNKVGYYSSTWVDHTSNVVWEDVTDQYKKPFDVVEKYWYVGDTLFYNPFKECLESKSNLNEPHAEDIIESQNMNYNQGRIFKIASTFNGKKDPQAYKLNLENIIYFARRELARINKEIN